MRKTLRGHARGGVLKDIQKRLEDSVVVVVRYVSRRDIANK